MIVKVSAVTAVVVLVAGFICSASTGKGKNWLRGGDAYLKNPDGPWEECMWMTGHECARFIQSQVPPWVQVEFVEETAADAISEYEMNRVIILVNNLDNVVEVPARGRRRGRRLKQHESPLVA